jgi:hypothetical protein
MANITFSSKLHKDKTVYAVAGSHRKTLLELAKENHVPIDFSCGDGECGTCLIKVASIDPRRIYLYGISNGASVVLNLAAELNPTHLKGVFSEAPTPVGIGYPWVLRVPVMIAFGREDDLGARLGQKRWMISDPCRFTIELSSAPPGTAQNCSDSQPQGRMLTTLEWAEKVKLEPGASFDLQYFEGVAHGAFLGPLKLQTAQQFASSRGFQMPADIGWSEGGTPQGQGALLAAALQFFGVQPAGSR